MAVKCKTFDLYIRELILHPERSTKWMNDRRLSIAEKRILKGHLLVRCNKYHDSISELSLITNSDIDFVNDHKNLLLGICYNNTGKYDEGYEYLKLAASGFESKGYYYHLFTTLFNLVNNLGNLGRIQEMASVVDKMKGLRISGKLQEIRLLRCLFMLASDSNNFSEAEFLLPRIHKLKSVMPESELGPQLICEFIFYTKIERIDLAEDVLSQMKKYRKFMVSENFHFMKKLINHLRYDETIYVYERNFFSVDSVLFRQIKVIEELHSQNTEEAHRHWIFLQERYGRELYKDDFVWGGEKCLFSLCLQKNREKNARSQLVLNTLVNGSPKYQILYEALKAAKGPVRSGELFEIVYGEQAENKDDLKKLALLVINIRKIYNVEIISRKGTYELINEINNVIFKRVN